MSASTVRVVVASANGRLVGGTETYLAHLLPELLKAGCPLAFWHELDLPADRGPIRIPAGVSRWCVSTMGGESALTALREWRPDVIYAHGFADRSLERALRYSA